MKKYIATAALFAALCTPAVSFAQYNPASFYVPNKNVSFVETYTPNYVATPTYQKPNMYQNQYPTRYQNQQNQNRYQNQQNVQYQNRNSGYIPCNSSGNVVAVQNNQYVNNTNTFHTAFRPVTTNNYHFGPTHSW